MVFLAMLWVQKLANFEIRRSVKEMNHFDELRKVGVARAIR